MDSLSRVPNRRAKALHVRATMSWPVSSLRHRVRVSVVLLSTGLVSMVQ